MDLAIGVAVGSSMQVALFLIPLLVIIGWGMGNDDMNLSFDLFQVSTMFVAVLLVNYLIGDGKSHWLEGFLLICLYAIIATCSFCKCTLGHDIFDPEPSLILSQGTPMLKKYIIRNLSLFDQFGTYLDRHLQLLIDIPVVIFDNQCTMRDSEIQTAFADVRQAEP